MEKQKRWHFALIIAVILLTIYNILPTVFYYTKPLKEPVNQRQAAEVSLQIAKRINNLQEDATDFLSSFAKNLSLSPKKIASVEDNPRFIKVDFNSPKEAAYFAKNLKRAGLLIPFVPSQLSPASYLSSDTSVIVERKIGTEFDTKNLGNYFSFSKKFNNDGSPTAAWRGLVVDRFIPIALAMGGESPTSTSLGAIQEASSSKQKDEALISLSRRINLIDKTFGSNSRFAQDYYASFTQTNKRARAKLSESLGSQLGDLSARLNSAKNTLSAETDLPLAKEQQLKLLTAQINAVESARVIVQKNSAAFKESRKPLTASFVVEHFEKRAGSNNNQTLDVASVSPYFSHLTIDWANQRVLLGIKPAILSSIDKTNAKTEAETVASDRMNQLLLDEVARIARVSHETIEQEGGQFFINLSDLPGSTSFLSLNLGAIAQNEMGHLTALLKTKFKPQSSELSASNYPIVDEATWRGMSANERKFALVVYAPATSEKTVPAGFKKSSYYVIARGLSSLTSAASKEDAESLKKILSDSGFFGYSGADYGFGSEYASDIIFEKDDAFGDLVKASREKFLVRGSQSHAVLELSDYEQRLITLNRIEDQIHEDMLRERDAYHAAQINPQLNARLDVPPPTHNVYWNNIVLSTKKFFRGDDRKVLKWGLDLSGGKSVRIGLKDKAGRLINNKDDLNEGVNQLYKRVNKMGLSEVSIRVEGSNILLDFPGSQGLSASELVKAASMTFHIVNEKFTPFNRSLSSYVNEFLQEVWNEAVVTNNKEVEQIQMLAWKHLGGRPDSLEFFPESESAKVLYENGLRLAGPNAPAPTSNFNDSLSTIALLRGEDFASWEGQTHPLLIVFHNFALEGSSLEKVQGGYDPQKGNILTFSVLSSGFASDGQKRNFRDDLFAWTNQFSQEKIMGTPKQQFSSGRGWRMAVILNGTIISSPALNSPIRDHAMITGHFTQREINQLVADLKAGSLSFTPKILSENNISPDLGSVEKAHGITAAALATFFVIIAMIVYYRFAGIVASVAVLFNLAIMWAVLQNLDAALTLPSIAGIILTIGMAVDANVLVYERVREELESGKRLPSALAAGYSKAFTAILDSNLTTIIAALILLQFDSGPIKGFALTLIIGIVSSMFTALFMTRYFFAGWVQNPKNKSLTMMKFLKASHFNFLKQTKTAIIASILVLVVGAVFLVQERSRILGMDFTGGYALTLNLEPKGDENLRESALKALIANGARPADVQVRELTSPTSLRIQLSSHLENPGEPFFGLPEEIEPSGQITPLANNPRIKWTVEALQAKGLVITQDSLDTIDQNWNQMSGQLSDAMRDQALIGLGLSLFCILIYLSIRFEFKYGMAAVIGLAHDLLITIGIIAAFNAVGISLQIDLQVIAALMTIVGYSLNDTIIIFDRIREDIKHKRKTDLRTVVNSALNATLSRTIMTSGTTILVLLTLVVFGGKAIFDFSMVMAIGVIVGTLSSLFVAAPLLVYLHKREEKKASLLLPEHS